MRGINKKELLISSIKSIFGTIPVAGTALTEVFFEYSSSVKQKRLNKFVELLSDYFTKSSDVSVKNIKTEDFSDLFEAVLKRVVTTKSFQKLTRFRDILVKEMGNLTEETELIDLYLDLITTLSEEELIILEKHKYFDQSFDNERGRLSDLNDKYRIALKNQKNEAVIFGQSKYENECLRLKNEIEKIENKHKPILIFKNANYYGIEESKFYFYKQRLSSKGLLVDYGRIGAAPFNIMYITEFGKEFINFIKL